jgi:hypothetical protein
MVYDPRSFEGEYEESQREDPAHAEARVAYWNSPEGKLALRAQELSGDYGDVRGIDPKNVPAIENILKQIGTENVATKAMAATLAQKYGISDLNQIESRPKVIPAYTESGGSDESFYSREVPEQTVNEWYNKTTGQVIPQSFATYDDGKATYFFGLDKTKDGNLTFNQPREPNARAKGMKAEAMMALAIASLVFDWSGQTGYAILGAGDALAGAVAAGEMAAGISAATGITVGANAIATGIGAAAVNTASTYLATGDPGAAFSAGATALVGTVGGSAAGLTAGAALTAAGVNPALASYLSSAIQGATSTALTGGEVDVSNMLRGALGAAAGAGVSNATIGTLGADAAKALGVAAQTYVTTGNEKAAIQSGLMSGLGSLVNPNKTVPATYRPPTVDELSSLDKNTMFGTEFYTDKQGVRYYVNDNGQVQPIGEADYQNLVKAQPQSTNTIGSTSVLATGATTASGTTTSPIGVASAAAYNKTLGEFNALDREAQGKINEANEFYNKEFKPIQDRRSALIGQINSSIEERRDYLAKYYDINDPNANRWGDSIRAIDPKINGLKLELDALDKTYQPALRRFNELSTEINGYNTRLNGIQNTLDTQSQVLNTDQSKIGVDANGALTYTPARFDIKNLPQIAEAGSISQIASDARDWLLDDSIARAVGPQLETVVIQGSRYLPDSVKGFFNTAIDFVKSIFAYGASGLGQQIQYFSNSYSMLTGTPLDKTYAGLGKAIELWGDKNTTFPELTRQLENLKNADQLAQKMDFLDAVPFLTKKYFENPLAFVAKTGQEIVQEGAPTAAGLASGVAVRVFFGAPVTTVMAARALGSAVVDGLETFGANGKEAETQALKEGKTPNEARIIGIYKGAIDALVTIPSEYLGDKATFKAVFEGINGGVKGIAAKYGSAIGAQGAGEFFETVTQCATSWYASDTKDPFPLKSCLAQGWTAAMVAGGTTAKIIAASDLGAVIGKTKDGNDVTLGEAISGTKLIDINTLKPNAVIGTTANGTKQTLGSLTAVSRDLGLSSPTIAEFLPQSMLSNDLVIATLPGGTPVTIADMNRFEESGGTPEAFMSSLSTANPVTFASFISPAAAATESRFATQTFFDNSVAARIQAGASPLDATKSVLSSMGIPASGVNLTALSQTLGGQNNAVAAVTDTGGKAAATTAPVGGGGATDTNLTLTSATTAPVGGGNTAGADLTLTSGAANAAVTNDAANNAANAVTSGVDPNAATNAAVTTAVNNGANTNAAVNGAVTGAVTTGANPNAAVNGAVNGAASVGADTNTAATVANNAATNAATNTAANNAATAINSGVDPAAATNTAVTTAVNNGASTDAAVNGAVTGAVNAGGNTNAAVNGAVTGAKAVGADTNTAANVATNAATGAKLTLSNTGNNLTPSANQNATAATNPAASAGTGANAGTNAVVNSTVNAATNAANNSATNTLGNAATNVAATNAAGSTVVNNGANTNAVTNAATNTGTNMVTGSNVTSDQMNGINTKIDGLSGDVASKFDSLTQGQRDLVSSQVKLGQDVNQAINNVLGSTAQQISGAQTNFTNQINSLSGDVKTKFDSLSQGQQAIVAAQVQQGASLNQAINNVAASTAQQISGAQTNFTNQINSLSGDVKTKFDSLSQGQQAIVAAQVQQGASLNQAINNVAASTAQQIGGIKTDVANQINSLSSDVKTKFDSLSQSQQNLVASQVQQGIDLNQAINNVATSTAQQIGGIKTDVSNQINSLSSDVKTKFDSLSQGQQAIVASQVQQGIDLNQAINNVATSTAQQIGGIKTDVSNQINNLSSDVKTKFDSLSQSQQAIVAAQVQQGIDLNQAINNATVQTNQNIANVKTDITQNINTVQDQFNARVDELVKQGQDYQTATQTALKELGSGVTDLQTQVTAEAEARQAAADEANRNSANQKAMQLVAPAAKQGSSAFGASSAAPSAAAAGALAASVIGGKSGFVSPLEAFSRLVQSNEYVPQQQPEGALMQSSHYSYGQPTDLNEILGLDDETDQVEQQAKAGGLMTPLMAAGGTTRYGKFAGGGLNVVHHAGKMRVDFRRGDAVTGAGDGQSDDIPAMLADGEFVIPADVVAALGNGSTKAGSDALYEMMHSIRVRARKGHPKSLPPPAKSPLDYISKRK